MSLRILLALSLGWTLFALPCGAQDAETSAPGVSFELRLKDGKTQFRRGERITIELVFSSTLPETYLLDAGTSDRGGRLQWDEFHIEPRDGAVDPLADYYTRGIMFSCSGFSSTPTLGEVPRTVELDLNEWLRFDRPGRYKLHVVTPRVFRKRLPVLRRPHYQLKSNSVELETLPAEAAWVAEQLKTALAALNSETPNGPHVDRRAACRALRFLDIEASVFEMAKRLGLDDPTCSSEYVTGLYGSSHREEAIKQLESRLAHPEHPINPTFLWTLSGLATALANPERLSAESRDEAGRLPWQTEAGRRQAERAATHDRYARLLADVLPQKHGVAYGITLQTVLETYLSAERVQHDPARAALLARLLRESVNLFDDLPARAQAYLLQSRWERIASPALLPSLHKVIENPSPEDTWVRGLAVRRIYELDPAEGRRLILEEMRRPSPDTSMMDILFALDDESLPELDDTLAENLVMDGGHVQYMQARLVERYASPAILPRVLDAYRGSKDCYARTPLLAYVLRVDYEAGRHLVQSVFENREDSCHQYLSGLASYDSVKHLGPIPLEYVADADPAVASAAAALIARTPSRSGFAPLLNRLHAWRAKWRGRAAELDQPDGDSVAESALESSLVTALVHAHGWWLTGEEIEQLLAACVTQMCRAHLGSVHSSSQPPFLVSAWASDGRMHWTVGRYQMLLFADAIEKIKQLPHGSTLTWRVTPRVIRDAEAKFSQLQGLTLALGMTLTR